MNGPRTVSSDGYIQIKVPGHPKGNSRGYVGEHILIAEKALGKFLPDGSLVHHHDQIRSNNENQNLVICQDRAYHMLIHARLRIFRAGGDPDLHKICCRCKKLKHRSSFTGRPAAGDGLYGNCRQCDAANHVKAYRKKQNQPQIGDL